MKFIICSRDIVLNVVQINFFWFPRCIIFPKTELGVFPPTQITADVISVKSNVMRVARLVLKQRFALCERN